MANDVAVRVSIDSVAVQAMLDAAPAQLQMTVRGLVEGAAIDVQREMRIEAPVAVTGDLRRSVRYTYTPGLLRAEVAPAAPYAGDVEHGSKPHYVGVGPGSSLRAWALQKGLNPYAVRNAIAKRGTKAHPFVQPTYDKMKPLVEESIATGITRMVEGLDRGI